MDKTPVQQVLAWLGEKELSPLADHIRKEFLPKEKVFIGEVWDAAMTTFNESGGPADDFLYTKETFISQYYKD